MEGWSSHLMCLLLWLSLSCSGSHSSHSLSTITSLTVVSMVTPISDVNVGSQFGVAIIQVDSSNGTWQFSTDGGHSWVTLTNVCPQHATLLRSSPIAMNKVRFVLN